MPKQILHLWMALWLLHILDPKSPSYLYRPLRQTRLKCIIRLFWEGKNNPHFWKCNNNWLLCVFLLCFPRQICLWQPIYVLSNGSITLQITHIFSPSISLSSFPLNLSPSPFLMPTSPLSGTNMISDWTSLYLPVLWSFLILFHTSQALWLNYVLRSMSKHGRSVIYRELPFIRYYSEGCAQLSGS